MCVCVKVPHRASYRYRFLGLAPDLLILVGSAWTSVFFKCFFDYLVVSMHIGIWKG